VLRTMAVGQHARGYDVRVLAVVEPHDAIGHPWIAGLRAAGVGVEVLSLPARAYVRERRYVRRYCSAFRPDVVHTHGYRPDVLHVGTARRLGISAVTTEHGASRRRGKPTWGEQLQLFSLHRFDAVVAVSRALADRLRGRWVRPDRLHIIPNAWNGLWPETDRSTARARLGLPQEGFVLGWVGRIIHAKGVDLLLRAVQSLADLPITVSLVGDGGERAEAEALARALGLAGRVRFHGAVDGASELYPAFDLFVLSSRTEGTPVVLFEAMAARVPVVATAVGGVPDVIRSGRDGWLVPPENVEELAAAIRRVYREPAAARARADSALTRLESEFGPSRFLDRYERLYLSLVGARRSRGPLPAARHGERSERSRTSRD
jgi:glycosyltransferase involved in cell wall biosynthesis